MFTCSALLQERRWKHGTVRCLFSQQRLMDPSLINEAVNTVSVWLWQLHLYNERDLKGHLYSQTYWLVLTHGWVKSTEHCLSIKNNSNITSPIDSIYQTYTLSFCRSYQRWKYLLLSPFTRLNRMKTKMYELVQKTNWSSFYSTDIY